MKRKARSSALLAGFVALFWTLALGPGYSQEGFLKGAVKDQAGQPLKDAKITFADLSTGNKYSWKSGRDGKYFKVGIPPATYKVSVELDGYLTSETVQTIVFGKEDVLDLVLKKILPKFDDDRDFLEGVALFKDAKYEEAGLNFEKVATRFSDHPEVFYNLGVSLMRSGDIDRAIPALEQALKLKPDMVEAQFAIGECYFNKGDKEKAEEAFARSTELQPSNGRAFYNLGIIYYRMDSLDEALESFKKSTELEPGFSSAFYQAGLVSIKKGDLKGALQYFETFLKMEPNAAEAAQVKAMIEELKKQIGQ
jgi:tetratricopeptide (TPR) repeat protein